MKKLFLLIFVVGLIIATQAFAITSEKISTTSPITFAESKKGPIDNQCECELYLENGTGLWYLKCSNKCDKMVKATCTYKIHYQDGTIKTKTVTNHIREYSETVVDQDYHEKSYCEKISVSCEIVEK